MSSFEKSLRGGTSTPRNSKVNNRYGPVGTGSRCMDAEELEGVGSPESSSPAAVSRNTTPRSTGRYGSPFGQMVSQAASLEPVCGSPQALWHPAVPKVTAAVLLLPVPPLTYRLPHTPHPAPPPQHGYGGATGSTPRGRSALAPPRPPVPRQNRALADTDADSNSVAESDDVSVMTEDDYGPQEGDSVQVPRTAQHLPCCMTCFGRRSIRGGNAL
jgi:hypothetical protein